METAALAAAVARAVQAVVNGIPQPAPLDHQAFANALATALGQQNPPAAGPFALAPALTTTDVIDYNTAAGAKIFSKASAALPTTFSLEAPNTRVLLEQVLLRGTTYGWDNVLSVPTGPAGNQVNRNMLTHHAQITKEDCLAAATTYIGQDNRRA